GRGPIMRYSPPTHPWACHAHELEHAPMNASFDLRSVGCGRALAGFAHAFAVLSAFGILVSALPRDVAASTPALDGARVASPHPQHATPTRDPRIERLRSGAAVDGHLQAPQAPSELAPSKTRLRGAQEQTESSIPADLQWSDRFRRPGLDGRVWALATYNGD